MRKLPPLNAVRAFEAAARHVSFTKAAVELEVTHGAVSRQVAALEAWVGIALFRRSRSQLALTEAGRAYAAEVTSLLDRLSVLSVSLVPELAPTVLHVSAPPTFTMRWLLPRLAGFQRRRPEVELRLSTSSAPVDFEANAWDVAIRGACGPLPGGRPRPFMREYVLAVCHVDIMERSRLVRPADFSRAKR